MLQPKPKVEPVTAHFPPEADFRAFCPPLVTYAQQHARFPPPKEHSNFDEPISYRLKLNPHELSRRSSEPSPFREIWNEGPVALKTTDSLLRVRPNIQFQFGGVRSVRFRR